MSDNVISGLDFSNKKAFLATKARTAFERGEVADTFDLSKAAYDLLEGGGAQEQVLGRKLLEECAEKGDVICLYNLALSYLYGRGGPRMEFEAYELFTQLATDARVDDRTRADSLLLLAHRALNRPYPDYDAVLWQLSISANLGNIEACYTCGLLYEASFCPLQNYEKSAYWYDLVKDVEPRAAYRLARLHLAQLLPQHQQALGLRLAQQAAEQGIEDARAFLSAHESPNGLKVVS